MVLHCGNSAQSVCEMKKGFLPSTVRGEEEEEIINSRRKKETARGGYGPKAFPSSTRHPNKPSAHNHMVWPLNVQHVEQDC